MTPYPLFRTRSTAPCPRPQRAPVTHEYTALLLHTQGQARIEQQGELLLEPGDVHLACDEHGRVRVNEKKETSEQGIYAAGDLTTMRQGAIFAAAEGSLAAAILNHDLALEGV